MNFDGRPDGPSLEKYEWVVRKVAEIVGTRAGAGFVAADDMASDIILELLNAGGFEWDEEEIVSFCRRKSGYMVLAHLGRKEKSECEFMSADDANFQVTDLADCIRPQQDIHFDAMMGRLCLLNIPNLHRQALEILCDGGNPIDVAEELNITPWAAIRVIKEAREYVTRVDPAYE